MDRTVVFIRALRATNLLLALGLLAGLGPGALSGFPPGGAALALMAIGGPPLEYQDQRYPN